MITPKQSPRLESWKEIAGYLARTVRTVQRWEETEGLPIHRQLHQALGNVYAYPDELDEWMAKRQVQPPAPEPVARKSRRWLIATAAVALLAAAVGAWLIARSLRPSEPVWLLVTALDNRTGEPLLDESVPFLLEREISNSSGVYVAPRARVDDSLKLMRKEPSTRVDEALGREAAMRDGGIRLVVSSRAERTGSAYLMTASVIDAASGRLIGGASEQARTIEEIAPAVRRLASAVRRAAGERTAGSAASQPGLERVTTPSLHACQLYSQAYRLGTSMSDWSTSEGLAREAIAEDPQFASAHIWLAYALRNQGKPEPEWRASLNRAVALSGSATDRERQFILASEKTMNHQREDEANAYRRMLVSYPDDYWARSNLAMSLNGLGRNTEAATELYRMADLRPNDPIALNRGMGQAMIDGKLREARRYRDRLEAIGQSNPDLIGPPIRWQMRLLQEIFPLHELWLAGKLEQMQAEIRRISTEPPADELEMRSIDSFYQTLGRLRDAEVYAGKGTALVMIAHLRDDPGALEGRLRDTSPPGNFFSLPWIQRDIKPDRVEALAAGNPILLKPLFVGRIAALGGDCLTAAREFDDFFRHLSKDALVRAPSLMARGLLARSCELAGDDAAALRSLQAADLGPAPMFWGGWQSTGAFWHRIRYDEARLLRKLGRQKEAEAIEAGLRRDLRLADPDHPILVRLNESNRRPFNVY